MNLRSPLVVLALAIPALLTACGSSGQPPASGGPPGDGAPTKLVYESGVRFRARGDSFEIGDASGWRPFFVKGVNLGVAKPGRFPGELAATKADYAAWLERIAELGCNVVRLYTLHFPAFYEAFGEYNRAHPDRPVYLIQGIWLDELAEGDYITDGSEQLRAESALVVDAVHGEARIAERLGKAHGEYRHDVSQFVLAWLPGHEMDGYMVQASNDAWPLATRHDGSYVVAADGLPIEAWVARTLDEIVTRDLQKYGTQRPVGWSNWPALDPIRHPTEPAAYGQDVVDADFGRFTTRGGYDAGIFVSYHVYPFNPEFICYDPGYAQVIDDRGKPNSYLGYLVELKARHTGVPLLVAEYGVPSSFGVAHVNETSFNHGGYSEDEQAAVMVDLLRSIVQSRAAGAIAFELVDEWFKQTWLTRATTLPAERAPLWHDVLSPEQSFGLIAFDAPGPRLAIDGDGAEWTAAALVHQQDAAPVAPIGDGHDSARTLRALHAAADPAFLWLRLDVDGGAAAELDDVVLLIGISTLPGATGDRRFPGLDVQLADGMGLEAVVVFDGARGVSELLIDEQYDFSAWLNGESDLGGTPVPNEDGVFTLSSFVVNSDRFYREANMAFVPEVKRYTPGLLRRGASATDTLAHFQLGAGTVELRLPWHALWVTDPSSHRVLDDDLDTPEIDATATSGFQLFAIAAVRVDGALRVVDALPRSGFAAGRFAAQGVPTFLWPGWDSVDAGQRLKPAFHALARAHAAIP